MNGEYHTGIKCRCTIVILYQLLIKYRYHFFLSMSWNIGLNIIYQCCRIKLQIIIDFSINVSSSLSLDYKGIRGYLIALILQIYKKTVCQYNNIIRVVCITLKIIIWIQSVE